MKKGFTLIELLAVITITGILAVMILPNLVGSYEKSLKKAMAIQESKLKDAATLMINDYCNQRISKEKYDECKNGNVIFKQENWPLTDEDGNTVYKTIYFVKLETLKAANYYENELYYEHSDTEDCRAIVLFDAFVDGTGANKVTKYTGDRAYVSCFDEGKQTYLTGGATDYYKILRPDEVE